MYTRSFLFIASLCFLLAACGYGREEDKEAARQEDLQELNREMEESYARIDSLKTKIRQRNEATTEEEPYNTMMARLEAAEAAYEEWRDDLNAEPGGMSHDERMQYYSQEEQRAEAIRQEMKSAIGYVERELP